MRFRYAFVLAVLAAPAVAAGQEIQVPLDEAGEIEEVDRALAHRLGLFLDEYPELQVIRLYEVEGEGYVLEVTFQRDGRTARERVPMTADGVRTLRGRVTRALEENAPEIILNQDGRFLLLGATTLLGLTYYGWAVPAVLDIDSGRGALATYMFTAGASFVAPYLYTRTRPVTYGVANAGFWGATRGLSHGVYLVNIFDDTPSFRASTGAALAVSLGEGLLGYTWASETDMDAGTVHTIGNFGDFGTAVAGEIMLIAQPSSDRLLYGTLLAGALGGVAAGARFAPDLPFTWGDAEIQRTAFALGAAHGGVVFDWLYGETPTDDDLRLLGGLLLAGSVGGTYLAHRMLPDHEFSVGEGILVELGTVAGGLLGMGVAVLSGPAEMEDATLLFTMGAIGADLGFLATFNSLADNARQRAERSDAPADARTRLEAAPRAGALELHLDPAALALLAPGTRANTNFALPLFSLRYRF
ncbi:MAG: hypothetical protein R6U63_13550 [Longimicrobiales bacterium]